jgi:hypothetical protein
VAERQEVPTTTVPYRLLEPGEQVYAEAQADDGAALLVTDRRVAVAVRPDRFQLDVPFEALRRIQFDIERQRPATLVIVPEHPSDQPVVLAIPAAQYESVARALAIMGQHLHEVSVSAGAS